MAKYINKTQSTDISPEDFIKSYSNAAVITDCLKLLDIFSKPTATKGFYGQIKLVLGNITINLNLLRATDF